MVRRLQQPGHDIYPASAVSTAGRSTDRELTEASRRVDNPELLGDLPDLNINTETLLHDIDAERASR